MSNPVVQETTSPEGTASLMLRLMRRQPLSAFFTLTFLLSWIFAAPLIASAQGLWDLQVPHQLHYLVVYSPCLAAVIVSAVAWGSAGLEELQSSILRWRVGLPWLLIAAFSMPVLFVFAAVTARIIEGEWPDFGHLGQVDGFPQIGLLGGWVLQLLIVGIGEETGWRGFALPRLQEGRSALSATMILYVFWALWHIPMFFYKQNFSGFGVVELVGFFLGILPGAILLTWLYNSSRGSILVVALWHAGINFTLGSAAVTEVVAAVLTMLIVVWALAVVAVFRPAHLSFAERQVAHRKRREQ